MKNSKGLQVRKSGRKAKISKAKKSIILTKAKKQVYRSKRARKSLPKTAVFSKALKMLVSKIGTKSRQLLPFAQKSLSVLLILLGATFTFIASTNSYGLDWQHPFLSKNTEADNQITQPAVPKPQTLFIPKLSRALNVSDGEVVNNRWTISPNGVSFLKTTPTPGSNGNSVIYGHNLQNILGDLYLLGNGDTVYVVLSNGNIVKYMVSETKEVTPQSVEILNQTADSRLTIYTCSGFLDQARFVVVARQV